MALQVEKKIELKNSSIFHKLCMHEHIFLKTIAKIFSIRLGARGETITLKGDKSSVHQSIKLINHVIKLISEGREISTEDIRDAALRMKNESSTNANDFLGEKLYKTKSFKEVSPKGPGQKEYVDAMKSFDLVFAVGPAGTGKTYLAMTLAVLFLAEKKISRIILTRPAVEAGEKLGFLPGSMEEKVSPYLRPLYDALFDLVGTEKAEEYVAHGIIEVAPLAFMRGRTLNNAFVILDEAQNTTKEQMKMALTRLGFGSKMVVTGDITQVDLSYGQKSGLLDAIEILKDVDDVTICFLSEKDVVRHPLVQSVVKAYERASIKSNKA